MGVTTTTDLLPVFDGPAFKLVRDAVPDARWPEVTAVMHWGDVNFNVEIHGPEAQVTACLEAIREFYSRSPWCGGYAPRIGRAS